MTFGWRSHDVLYTTLSTLWDLQVPGTHFSVLAGFVERWRWRNPGKRVKTCIVRGMMHEPHVGASREAEQMVTVTVDFCMFEKWQKS